MSEPREEAPAPAEDRPAVPRVPLRTVLREWGRIGCIGFGGPPAHIRLLRQLCVERKGWLDAREFEDAIAVCNLLPGPASTQLAIFCAWRLRGRLGALIGGAAFIVPGLIVILALAVLFVASSPPLWVLGAGAGAGAAVPAVAVNAGWSLLVPSWRNRGVRRPLAGLPCRGARGRRDHRPLAGAGPARLRRRRAGGPVRRQPGRRRGCRRKLRGVLAAPFVLAAGGGVLASVAWVAFKVGGLSFGGGFVIIPLMQADAVNHYHWMTGAQFLNAVALGQITPGPVVQTVAVVGYAAAGLAGGLLASAVAFTPSFLFVLFGGPRFQQIRGNAPRPRLPRRRRPRRHRRHPRLGHHAHPGAEPPLAVRGAGRRPRPAAPAAPRGRPHPAVRRRDRRHHRPDCRHRLTLTLAGSMPANRLPLPTPCFIVYRRLTMNSTNSGPLGREIAAEYASWFRALADATRVQIVSLLARRGEPMSVGAITAALDVGQSTVSAHLKVLADVRFRPVRAARHLRVLPGQRGVRGLLPDRRRHRDGPPGPRGPGRGP